LSGFQAAALSADGQQIVAVAPKSSAICVSTNFGATWATNPLPKTIWQCVASSADGTKLAAGAGYVCGIYTASSIPSPKLALATQSNSVAISWTIPSTNFILRQSADLAVWSDVTNVPVLNLTNLQNQVTLPASGGSGFYRLKTP